MTSSVENSVPSARNTPTSDRIPSVTVPVLSVNNLFKYPAVSIDSELTTKIFSLLSLRPFIELTRAFIIGKPSGTAMIIIVTEYIIISAIKEKVFKSKATLSIKNVWNKAIKM